MDGGKALTAVPGSGKCSVERDFGVWPEVGLAVLGLLVLGLQWPEGGLWGYEVQSLIIALNAPAPWSFLANHESHPPGFYLLLRAWAFFSERRNRPSSR